MTIILTDAERDFIERMGLNSEADGQPRITGRVWGLLAIAGEPLSSATIAETLDISRGSVSTNIRMLEMLELIERQTKPGEREIYFAICDQPYSTLIRGFAKRFANYRKMVEKAREAVDRPQAQKGLQDLVTFYEVLERGHSAMLTDLEDADER